MAAKLEEVISNLTEKHFPLARVRKRSNEAPWITRNIRRLWKQKLRLYKKGGRCEKWWDTEHQLQKRIDESREAFVERILEEGNSSRSWRVRLMRRSWASGTSSQAWIRSRSATRFSNTLGIYRWTRQCRSQMSLNVMEDSRTSTSTGLHRCCGALRRRTRTSLEIPCHTLSAATLQHSLCQLLQYAMKLITWRCGQLH